MNIFLFGLIALFITFGATFLYSCFLAKFKNIDKETSYPCILIFTAIFCGIFIVAHNWYAPCSDAENKIEAKYQSGLNSLNNEIENYVKTQYTSKFEKAYKSENCFADFEEIIRLKRIQDNLKNNVLHEIKFSDICLKRDAWKQEREYCFCKCEALSILEKNIATLKKELRAKPEIDAIYEQAKNDAVVLSLKKKMFDLGKWREKERNDVVKKREFWTLQNFGLAHVGISIILFIGLFIHNKLSDRAEKNRIRKRKIEEFVDSLK